MELDSDRLDGNLSAVFSLADLDAICNIEKYSPDPSPVEYVGICGDENPVNPDHGSDMFQHICALLETPPQSGLDSSLVAKESAPFPPAPSEIPPEPVVLPLPPEPGSDPPPSLVDDDSSVGSASSGSCSLDLDDFGPPPGSWFSRA